MKIAFCIVIFCAVASSLFAADADPTKIIKERLDPVKPILLKAKLEYEKKVQVEISKVVKQLEEDLKKEMKNGNLEKANAIKSAIDKIKTGKELDELINSPVGNLLGDKYVSIVKEFKELNAVNEQKQFVLAPHREIFSSVEFTAPIDIKYYIATTNNNIRIGFGGAMIFNWELDHDQLRIDGGPVSGRHIRGAGRIPINKVIEIRQVVEKDKMTIFVESKEVASWNADFSNVKQKILLKSVDSPLTIQDVKVKK